MSPKSWPPTFCPDNLSPNKGITVVGNVFICIFFWLYSGNSIKIWEILNGMADTPSLLHRLIHVQDTPHVASVLKIVLHINCKAIKIDGQQHSLPH